MRFKAPACVRPTPKVEKEARLTSLIGRWLAANGLASKDAPRPTFLLIAHSIESPIAKAVEAHVRPELGAGFAVRAIFAKFDLDPVRHAGAAGPLMTFTQSCRQLTDVRLSEAHEQLVLGSRTVWIGDSLRRDPTKRDAYEALVEDCPETAFFALSAFERLWNMAEPVERGCPAREPAEPEAFQAAASALLAGAKAPSKPSAASRR